jgi:hypothetical protein
LELTLPRGRHVSWLVCVDPETVALDLCLAICLATMMVLNKVGSWRVLQYSALSMCLMELSFFVVRHGAAAVVPRWWYLGGDELLACRMEGGYL